MVWRTTVCKREYKFTTLHCWNIAHLQHGGVVGLMLSSLTPPNLVHSGRNGIRSPPCRKPRGDALLLGQWTFFWVAWWDRWVGSTRTSSVARPVEFDVDDGDADGGATSVAGPPQRHSSCVTSSFRQRWRHRRNVERSVSIIITAVSSVTYFRLLVHQCVICHMLSRILGIDYY